MGLAIRRALPLRKQAPMTLAFTSAGIDGCPGGWVAITRCGAFVDRDLDRLLNRLTPDIAAVDMPIGLTDDAPRTCDRQARRLLGQPRGTSVFAPPVRAALTAHSYAEASGRNARACGRRLSIQTYNLLPKIRQIDTLLRSSNRWRAHVFEAHPEVCFAAMNQGSAIPEPKRRAAGRQRRQELIAAHFGAEAFAAARISVTRRDAADDDIADAFACLFIAERIANNSHASVPDHPPRDRHGLPMRIVY